MDFPVPPVIAKRDGRVLFDQLRVPPELVPYLAWPPTTRRRLRRAGATTQLLRQLDLLGLPRDAPYYPCSLVWAMGFAWASFAAQSHTVALREASGAHSSTVLAQDAPSPAGESLATGVATDDVIMLFAGAKYSAQRDLDMMDDAAVLYGMERNTTKDVDLERTGTAVGISLVDGGARWAAPPGTIWRVWTQVLALVRRRRGSPLALQTATGSITWLHLLRRPLFALLRRVYSFCEKGDPQHQRDLSPALCSELLVNAVMGAFWEKPTALRWCTELGFTDASDTGLGVVRVGVPDHALMALARAASGHMDHVILDIPHEPVRPRAAGTRSWVLILSRHSMRAALREPRKDTAHINIAEARAVLRWVQIITRSASARGCKLVVVVDSKVVRGALNKGRSPSWSLNRVLQQIDAVALACGVWLEVLYTPSEFNVGDLPSRDQLIFDSGKHHLTRDFHEHLGLIRDLGTPRARGPPLRRLLRWG